MHLLQRCQKDQPKCEPARMLLTDSTAVARQVSTPIRPKSSTRKTACLDLTSGPQPLQGTGKHMPVVSHGEVRSGTACCIQAGHVLVYIHSHGTFLRVNHAFGLHMAHALFTSTLCDSPSLALGSTFRASPDQNRP